MRSAWIAPLLLVGAAVLFAGGFWTARALRAQSPGAPAVVREIQYLKQLVTVKMTVSKILDAQKENWLGKDQLLLVAVGEVRAGIDLAKLREDGVVIDGKSVTIKLPPAEIVGSSLVDEETYVFDRRTSLFVVAHKDLERDARIGALRHIVAAARKQGIEREAGLRAKELIVQTMRLLGFETVTIEGLPA